MHVMQPSTLKSFHRELFDDETALEFRNLQHPTLPPPYLHSQIAAMSDGEVEVEAVAGYQVLPKEVTEEIGSIKLFNKWYATPEGMREKKEALDDLG